MCEPHDFHLPLSHFFKSIFLSYRNIIWFRDESINIRLLISLKTKILNQT